MATQCFLFDTRLTCYVDRKDWIFLNFMVSNPLHTGGLFLFDNYR